ncbi:thiamine pyrophosphate-binding protein [Paracoccus alkanivorans]|uniref:Thiamine pyrophosphate-binding protein n=1 Tax=Paracoccus alkanivorans TaxID=2116655 RepID=A0A3M0MCU9_9RHOB|nr:thiamine pyrophosphate-binding protein [Paracoccus alkanivorans]RMC35441.1 thiamine pyrophosphate-binding protein [Paracoccus alkanivorans]
MTNRTGAEIIGRVLADAGATRAFGVPGGEVLALIEGLDRAGVRFTLVRHENAGGFFAEGHWHVTGDLPVLVATLGPGVANAVNVVANAMQDRVPLIFLTGCVDAAEAECYTHQVFDHQALLRPVVKASFRAVGGAVGAVMEKAITIARSGQPGPVHIDVPISVAEGESDEPPLRALPFTLPSVPHHSDLERIRKVLAGSVRPLMIAGVDAVNDGAGPAIASFCRQHRIPLITSYKGKGLMDETDPLCLGGAGLSPRADKVLMPLISEADLVLLAGYDPIEMRIGWRDPWGDDARVIEIAPVPRTHGMHRADETLIGDVGMTLEALHHDAPARWSSERPAQAREALAQSFAGPEGWGPHQVFRTLRQIMPPQTVVTADSGAHRILASQIWTCPEPRLMLQSSALCTMACALPLAAGACLGRPETPVLAILGDGGLEMGAGDLATLRDLKLPVILAVLVDGSLSLIEMKQRAGQRPNLGVDFGGVTDYPALAQAFGGHGVWIDDATSLAAEAGAALERDHFTLLAIRIGPRAYDGAF